MKTKTKKFEPQLIDDDPVQIVLPEPEIQGLVDPALYPGLVSREVADSSFLLVDVSVAIPAATRPDRAHVYSLYLDDTNNFTTGLVISETLFFSPPTPVPPTYQMRIPQRLLTNGYHHISYKVLEPDAFGGPANEGGSPRADLVIDRTAPYDSIPDGPRRLTLPPGWPGSLTEAFLAANPTGVPFGIPDYAAEGAAPGDRWRLFYGESNDPVAEGPVFPDRVIRYTRALAAAGDGTRALVYRLVDAAGNISERSFELPITVSLSPAPTLLPAAIRDAVALSGLGDRLIDRADTAASSGMFVIIPSYDADRTGDSFIVSLTTPVGTRDVGPYPLGGAQLPYNFHIDFSILKILYGASTGRIDLSVEYTVVRHGVRHRVPTATIIGLDLDVGGPVNPIEPELFNPALPSPVLFGKTSGLRNQLNASDYLQDADVQITLWSAAPLPATQAFDIVLYYQNEEVDRESIPLGTVPVAPIPMVVPWPAIQRHSNNLIPLRYEIALTTTHNRTSSFPQEINVNANVISFLPPRVLRAFPELPGPPPIPGEISCYAVQGGNLQVIVPPHPLLEQGMIVRVNWTACSDDDGMVPIPAASDVFSFGPISFEQAQIGFNVPIGPYATYLKPINEARYDRGSVKITYEVPVIGMPTSVESAEAVILVRAIVPGFPTPAYCDGSPWPS